MPINPNDISTIRVGQLPHTLPLLTNRIPHEAGIDLYQCTIQELIDLLNLNVGTLQYEVKRLNVDQAYIDANFDISGLGKNICLGFAICNGNNGTSPMGGHVGLAQNSEYPVQSYGGEKTHNLTVGEIPAHSHTNNGSANDNGDPGQFVITSPTNGGETVIVQSSSIGGSTAHNNLQPYISQLYIMKL